jgi:hypothetical protein
MSSSSHAATATAWSGFSARARQANAASPAGVLGDFYARYTGGAS